MAQLLTHKPKGRRVDFRQATLGVSALRNVSALRVGLEVLLLGRGPGRVTSNDYFLQGVWRPGLTWAERKQFIGGKVNQALNRSLNPPYTQETKLQTADKLVSARLLRAADLPMPGALAVAGLVDPGGGLRWLDGPAAVLAFLREPGILPCFGKPVHGSTGVGAVSIIGADAAGQLLLGDGKTVAPEDLVAEFWAAHPRGFLFEELLRPSPELARIMGPVIGTLRVVTVDAGSGPEVLYTTMKTPGAGAMVDGLAGPVGCYAAVDRLTGTVLRLQDRRQLGGIDAPVNPVSGVDMTGAVLPDFAEALRLAIAAHRCLPERGLLGIDIMLTNRGPLVTEMNASPFHSSYQTAFARGILNADLLPKLLAVRKRFSAVTPRPKYGPLP